MKFIVLFFLSLHFLEPAYAVTLKQKTDKLLRMPNRPTVIEFMKVMGTLPEKNPFKRNSNYHEDMRASAHANGPKLIAALEYMYPGFVFAPMGRDVEAFADVVEAYFLQHGIQGRVKRLYGSGSTIYGNSARNLLRLLKSSGFDPAKVKQNPPVVLFDNTGFSSGSQSTQLMRAGWNAAKQRGVTAKTLIQRLNVVSISRGEEIAPGEINRQTYFKNQGRGDLPTQILYFQEQDSMSYLSAMWHNGYGAVVKAKNGSYMGRIGPRTDRETRLQVLSDIYEICKAAQSPKFHKAVSAQARRYGLKMKDLLKGAAENIEVAAPTSLDKLVKGLKRVGEQHGYYSDNGQELSDWLSEAVAFIEAQNGGKRGKVLDINLTVHKFIDALLYARASNRTKVKRIGARDFRRLMAEAFNEITPGKDFYDFMADRVQKYPYLLKVLNDKHEFFTEDENVSEYAADVFTKTMKRLRSSGCEIAFLE